MQDPYGYHAGYGGYSDPELFSEPVYDGFGNAVGEAVYDGLGNPLGFSIPGISSIARGLQSAVKSVAPGLSKYIPQAANLASKVLPGLIPGVAAAGAIRSLLPAAAAAVPTAMSALPAVPMPMPFPRPAMPFRPPWPTGWMRPQLPYTGLGPNRLYMRCAVWPGPQGLVPGIAQGAQAALQQTAQVAAQRAAAMGRRRHRPRRRR